MKAQPWAVALGCFVAGSLAAVGIANATSAPTKIPDSTTGVITACMVKKTGAVRFINAQAGKTCTKKEKKITFNKTGPQGEQGEQGGYAATSNAPTSTSTSWRDPNAAQEQGRDREAAGRSYLSMRPQRPPRGNNNDARSSARECTAGTSPAFR